MKPDTSLKTVLQLVANPDPASSSEDLVRARDALDIRAAEATLERLEEQRRGLLLTASDREIERVEAEIRAERLDLDRRRAATQAMAPLIAAAFEREAQEHIERLAAETRSARLRAIEAYVGLDAAALRIVDLLQSVSASEAKIAEANQRFREAGRGDLVVGQPMEELASLTGVEGQYLPVLSRWVLDGYTTFPTTSALGHSVPPMQSADRRFGRLAELLPDATPTRKAA